MQLPQPMSRAIVFLLDQIAGGAIKIPQFQREFVWRPTKSAKLADSILKGFPIGTFIIWKTKDRLRQIKDIGGLELPSPEEGDYIQYVIDGQQRLTSLFAAIGGKPTKGTGISKHERIYVDFDAGPDDDIVITNVSGKRKDSYTLIKNIRYEEFHRLGLREEYSGKFALYKSRLIAYHCPTIEIEEAAIHEATEIFTRINILGLPKEGVIEAWPKAREAILNAVDYLRQGLHVPVSALLPYKHLVVPFAYFFANHPNPPAGEMQDRLVDFFWRVSLSGRYSFALEGKMAQDLRAIDAIMEGEKPSYDYPVRPDAAFIMQNGDFNAQRSFVKAILCLFAEKGPKNFKNNSDINVRGDHLRRSNGKNYHHFFPKGNPNWRQHQKINHIGNITLVDEYLNKGEIRDKNPSDYMGEFARINPALDSTMATHLIDLNEAGVWDDDYNKFLAYRCEAIARELAEKLIPQGIDTRGQSPNEEDVEDLETAQREQVAADDEE